MVLVFHDAIKATLKMPSDSFPMNMLYLCATRSSLDRVLEYEFIYQNFVPRRFINFVLASSPPISHRITIMLFFENSPVY